MNKQQGANRIEWCDFTHNITGGCLHKCAWEMGDGQIANCYAEDVANGVASKAYPHGFEHHYFRPEILDQPLRVKTPSRIFLGSMADLFGHWVPDAQIEAILDMCRRAHWHTFQVLTKNPPRLKLFKFSPNVWVGASVPPTMMFGKRLTTVQQARLLQMTLKCLDDIDVPVRWLSIEPLSWNLAPFLWGRKLQWAVIGAASNGRTIYQPDPWWVTSAIAALDYMGAAVFFKGNLRGNLAATPWREEFPGTTAALPAVQQQMVLPL